MKSSLLSPFGNTSSLNQAGLNGDGYLDMITTNPSGWVGVMFGKPGGTFNAGATYALGSFTAQATAAGDFNGDGILDIAVLNYGPGSVSVMLGRGNGLFLPIPVRYKSGAVGTQFAVGDVNRDGKLDILVAQNPINNSAPYGLLLGNSDGTFQPGKLLQSICDYGTNQLMLVDLNGDGNLDAVTQSGVSLGNGDGTFRKWMSFSTSDMDYAGQSFALGDFNNDGKLDLALSDWRLTNTISIHLGNGTGQFNASSSYHYIFPLEIQPGAIAVGRFTRDGNLGVVAGSREQGSSYSQRIAHGMFKIFAGQGDGTLLPGNSFQLLQDLSEFSVADFNGDGLDDVAVFNQGSTDSDVEGLFERIRLSNAPVVPLGLVVDLSYE